MQLKEKGTVFAVSLQKSVRDRMDGIRVTSLYFGLCWISVGICILLLSVGLWNAATAPSEKGFYSMSYLLSLFACVAVLKNVRDLGGSDDQAQTAAAVG